MFKVDKKVPLPAGYNGPNRRYPFHEMEVGDSFLIPGARVNHGVRATAYHFGRRHNMKFTCRMVDEGMRVWRVK